MRVLFLVNGECASPAGIRATELARRMCSDFSVQLVFRTADKQLSIVRFLFHAMRWRPDVCYVMDMAYSGVVAGAVAKCLGRTRLVIDTGDAIAELARAIGRRGTRLWLTHVLERFSIRFADHLVVRSHFHRELMHSRKGEVTVIPDGVDVEAFTVSKGRAEERFVIGVIGTAVWNEQSGHCYGKELVEVIHLLRDEPVSGVMVGGGSGIPHLRALCRRYGIENRIRFTGKVSYESLPMLLAEMDICLSTQTNDVAGWVRTTGKLPLYMASGRYILATRVGEAARVLDEEMLVEYRGQADPEYSLRLAERVRMLLREPERLSAGRVNTEKARRLFDYDMLASKLQNVLRAQVALAPKEKACPVRST